MAETHITDTILPVLQSQDTDPELKNYIKSEVVQIYLNIEELKSRIGEMKGDLDAGVKKYYRFSNSSKLDSVMLNVFMRLVKEKGIDVSHHWNKDGVHFEINI